MQSVFDLQKGTDYDLKSDVIVCVADRDGAQVFEVSVRGRNYRVLAHNRDDAESAAVNHDPEMHPGDYWE